MEKSLAADSIKNPVLNSEVGDVVGVDFFNVFLPKFITLAFIIGIIIFLFIMLLGAIQWITSGGDKTAVEGAKGKLTNGVIGIIILLAVFALVKVIGDFFGIDIFNLNTSNLKI